ncbi:MAG: methyltransferase domain-containing protein, partial [Methylobacteriaceae bacterium]|nr:methyltransferase domain-containing protein [Methylobacteriaceae bacterium]
GWQEVRLDIDPEVRPDIVASITDLGPVPAGSCDAIWCSHNLEHLCAHEVPRALAEFRRVLNPSGFALIRSPDLAAVCAILLERGPDAVVYRSPAGPVTAIDMLYGHSASIARGNAYMRHGTGFTRDRLDRLCREAGFASVLTGCTESLEVWAAAFMPRADEGRIAGALRAAGLRLTEAAGEPA